MDVRGSFPVVPGVGRKQAALLAPPPPPPASVPDYEKQMQTQETAEAETLGKLSERLSGEERMKAEHEAQRLQLAAKSAEELKETTKKAMEPVSVAVKDMAEARFEPTQRAIQENAALFSLIGVIGFAIGAGGKQNAMQAMSAMNGMVQGVQSGDMDRYQREKSIFETKLKSLTQQINVLEKEATRAIDLAKQDKEAARLTLDAALAQQGADFLKKVNDKQGMMKTLEIIRQKKGAIQRAWDIHNKAEEQARQKAQAQEAQRQLQRERLASQEFQTRERIASQEYQTQQRLEAAAKKGTASGGALNNRYAFNINEAFAQAAVDLLNVSQMPGSTTLGMFAGMTGQSGDTLTKSLANTFARKVTPEDSRLMQQIVSGLDQNMARALGGGYANSSAKGVIDAYKQQVSQSGDSSAAQAMFLARMKQELGVLAKAFKNHPGANEGYVADMRDYMESLDKAIPFNVQQVISANRGNKKTISEKFENLSKQPSSMRLPAVSPSAPVATTPETPAALAALPPQPAIDALLRGEGTDAQFDEAFGPGAAARARGAR